MEMRKLSFILAILAVLFPQASLAAAVPSKLSGVIVMSCVTTDAGAKVDEEIYKIDFVKKQVNNEPVELEISDISLVWFPMHKEAHPGVTLNPAAFGGELYVTINRYSGVLKRGVRSENSKRLTVCRVAGARKF
jgi:hypothetical protein